MHLKTRFISHEERRVSRKFLSEKHGFSARLYQPHSDEFIDVQLQDFSSMGYAIAVPDSIGFEYEHGADILVRVSPLKNRFYDLHGKVIAKIEPRTGYQKISAVMVTQEFSEHGNHSPVCLPEGRRIKGQIVHPFFYCQRNYFDVERLSADGVSITNIHPDCVLFEGMEVEYSLGVFHNLQKLKGVIHNIRLTEKNCLSCYISLAPLGRNALNELSKYCFHYAQNTPRAIRLSGFKNHSIKELVQYRFVETQAEYEAVLNLRRATYSKVNKIAKDAPLANLSYFYDDYSRILMALHNDRVVGSCAITYGEKGNKPFEIETLISEDEFKQLPEHHEMVEVAALCIDSQYRDADILHGIFENLYRECMETGIQYIIASSDKYLLKLYKNIGFRQTGISFIQPKYNNLHMDVLIIDEWAARVGKGLNPIVWWLVWGRVSEYLFTRNIVKYTPSQRVRFLVNKFLYQFFINTRRAYRRALDIFRRN